MKAPWLHFFSEFIGTALLVLVGLSFVILDFGKGSPIVALIPDPGARRALTGFFFGSTGGLIALSWVGKVSGAHINPVVTLAFVAMGKLRFHHAAGYIVGQLAGAVLGALPLLAWGKIGASIHYGATFPGKGYSDFTAVGGEIVTTYALVIGLFFFIRHKTLRNYTPALFPFLYALMVFLEAPISGTSTNPARSLGPVVVSGDWNAWWVYWAGPVIGALVAVGFYRVTWLRKVEIEVAKLYHFEHDPHHVFRWK